MTTIAIKRFKPLHGRLTVYTEDNGILTPATAYAEDYGGQRVIASGDEILPLVGWPTAAMRPLYDSIETPLAGYVGCDLDGSVNDVNV